jgi:ubiquinol-cytochrome c reductase cytochrome c subunit
VLRTGRMPPGDVAGRTRGPISWSDPDREALMAWMTENLDLEGDTFVPPDGDAARGRDVYAANCAQCHGYTGEGGVAGAGAITPRVAGLDPVVIGQAIRVGPFEMPPFAADQIPDEAVGDVVAYLHVVEAEEGTLVGLVELNPVYMAAFVFLLAVAVILSCVWIAGRVEMFGDPEPDEPGDEP